MKKHILSMYAFSTLMLGIIISATVINPLVAEAETKSKSSYTIAYVVERGRRSANAKYLYKDLLRGLKKTKANYEIDFIAIAKANKKVFTNYDVVIVVNQKSTDVLRPEVASFVAENKAQKNMIVTAFLPKGKSTLSGKTDIDVISSASREKPAAKFVINILAPRVIEILQAQ